MQQQTQGARRRAVLYVEDEEFDALFMRRAFVKTGIDCEFHVVGHGQLAVDYLSGRAPFADRTRYPIPTLVLLDLNLPVLSGFDLLHYLREHPEISAPPVVVFSSSARPDDRTKALGMGATDYLEKPSSGLEFTDVAQRLWDQGLAKA